ncbi:hypothetical protein MASR1M107_17540 [Ignavibacteriales bacterium]
MKRTILLLSVLVLVVFNINAQMNNFPDFSKYPGAGSGNFEGGAGLIWIDGKPHYALRFTPDVSFANFGVGMDLNLEFTPEGKLRDENYKTASQILSIIRYVRYGQKKDDIYAKVGMLDYYTLGQGNLIYMYNNSSSFDNRKTGFNFDVDMGKWGFESMYSDFASGGVAGLRGFVRPLRFSEAAAKIPVISNLEVGLSFASDFNDKAGVLKGNYDSKGDFVVTEKKSSVGGFSIDLGLPVIKTDMVSVDLFTNYTKMSDYGSGINTGFMLSLSGLGMVKLSTKFERRFNEGKFLPSYFDGLYEIERFAVMGGAPAGKIMALESMGESDNGWFGALRADIANYAVVYGSYQRLDKTPNSGILQLKTDLSPKDGSYVLNAGYEKSGIQSESELFTTDERSHAYVEVGYKPYKFLVVSLVYHWTYLPLRDGGNNVIGYEPQKRIEPRVSFVMPFNF